MRIIDTNVLIDNPNIIAREDLGELGIAWPVLEELDRIKVSQGERAKKARIVSRRLRDWLGSQKCVASHFSLTLNNSIQFIDTKDYNGLSVDNQLLYLCKDNGYILVTNDVNLQVKCIALDVQYESYDQGNDIYTGILRLYLPKDNELVCQLYSNELENLTLYENEYIFIQEDDDVKDILVYRHGMVNPISHHSIKMTYDKDLNARNPEQECLIDALYSNATILYAGGEYGVGKSYLTTAYAVQELEAGHINRIVYVPNNSQNENSMELGSLPGDMYEKILPYIGTITDILGQQQVLQLYESGQLEILPIAFARGRNLENAIVLVNEAQNLTEDHVKLLIARCGEGTKIIFDGDIKQADSAIFRQRSGLKLLTKLRFSEDYSNIFSAVRLEQIERSKTAQAAGYLDNL